MNILIIEDDEQACIELQTCIEEKKDLRLCACTNNATDALHLTQEFLPEVVILDLELNLNGAGGNGLEYLAALQKIQFRHRPCIVVTTNNTSQIILSTARKYGADIILTKYQEGFSAEYVIKTICLMQDTIESIPTSNTIALSESPADIEHNMRVYLQTQFDHLGMKTKYHGYKYLIDAIIMLHKDPSARVQQRLAQRYGTTDNAAERAMQNAIKSTWRSADPQDLQHYYTAHIDAERGCPTLMEFIHYYLNQIQDV